MPSAPVRLPRHFLTWDGPWLPQAVAWLAREWDGTGPLDLSRVLAIVPTRQSGRRLREALAGHAAVRGAAVFAPRVLTPDTLVNLDLGPQVASRLESLLAWTEVFQTIDLAEFRDVFPVDPPMRNFPWALRLAQEFTRLQSTLSDGCRRLGDVPTAVGTDFVEAARWRQIAELDKLHDSVLTARELHEPHTARIEAGRVPSVASGYERVVVLAVPDLQPLALARLSALAETRTVDVVIFAPESEADTFDGCGRPLPGAWDRREIVVREFEQRTHLCADPANQAAQLAKLAHHYTAPAGVLAIGVADPEIAPLLESELTRLDRPTYNPMGRQMRREALYELLTNLAAFARDPAFTTIEALARCPDILACLRAHGGPRFSSAGWLEALDDLRARHLPADLAAAREHAGRRTRYAAAAAGLEIIERIRTHLTSGSFAQGSSAALREIFGARRLDLSRESDARWQEDAAAWTKIVQECAAAERSFGRLKRDEWWDLALRLLSEVTLRSDDKPTGAIELHGWLELLWEDAPHLAVAGVNDGRVPEAVIEDAFLPESLRQCLGLETNATRSARDAYILQAIAACRDRGGRLDLFFGKTAAAGDPLKPSRLLLRCPDSELPARIAFLFRAPEIASEHPAWKRSWKLTPRTVPPPSSVGVTALRRYLSCPFRFYLRNVLGMDTIDPLKSELDAFDFGTLCHTALEQIGLDSALRDCTDAGVLRRELLQHLDHAVGERYGKKLSLPLIVQVESARQRLAKLAELQAGERAAGWKIVQVERPFEAEVSGLIVRGKIDRIDRHEATGAVRVIDYKTSDTRVMPAEAHLRTPRAGERLADWVQCEWQDRPFAWADLQLPMYLRAVGAEYGGRISCGYFNLPKAAAETTLALWDDYSPELHAAAMRCAEGACAAIRAGNFWPPNETIRAERDECAALFHHGSEASVEWPAR